MARKMMRMKKRSMKRSMKKKAAKKSRKMKKRVSKVARNKRAKNTVFRGNKERTVGGLRKSDLIKNKRGKVVSKRQSEGQTKRSGKRFTKWGNAVVQARKRLAIKGFCPVGGKTPAGQRLLKQVRALI